MLANIQSTSSNRRIFVVLSICLFFLTCCREYGLREPKYDLKIEEVLKRKNNFRIKTKHLNGKPRRIIVERRFSVRTIKFYKYSEWFWSKDGRLERLVPSGVTWIQGIPCRERTYVFFHRNGNLSKCLIGIEKWKFGRFTSDDKMTIAFYPNGQLRMLMLASASPYVKNGIEYAVVRFTDEGTFLPDRPRRFSHEIRKIE